MENGAQSLIFFTCDAIKNANVLAIWCWYGPSSLQLCWKQDSGTVAFLEILRIFSACNLIKKRLKHRSFLMNFQKFFSLQLYLKQDSGTGGFFCQFCEIFAEYLRRAVSNDIIIAKFFCKIFCSLKCKIKGYQRILLLKTAKTSSISSNSFLYLRKYLINQNKNYIFLIRKLLSFCDQNLQFVAF